MSGVFTDQAFVDLLVERVRHRFRYVGAWRLWLEYGDGYWRAHQAVEHLREAYLESLADLPAVGAPSPREIHQRQFASSASSQQWALWLLERDQRMTAAPEEFAPPGPYRLRPDPLAWDSAGLPFRTICDLLFPIGRDHLQRYFPPAYARGGEIELESDSTMPNILLRTGSDGPDAELPELGVLYPPVADLLGEECLVCLGPRAWTSFPDSLSPSLALQLTGARLAFLEGPEKNKKNPPQAALLRWARGKEAAWIGHDHALHRLRLPTHFIVCGSRWRWGLLEPQLRQHVLPLEG